MKFLRFNQHHGVKTIYATTSQTPTALNILITQKRRNLWLGKKTPQQQQQGGNSSDYYTVLNISPSASQKQIKAAYYKRSLVLHPDRNIGVTQKKNVDADGKFAELNEAYRILGNNQSRKEYDRKLKVRYQYQQTKTSFSPDVIEKHVAGSASSNVRQNSRQYDTWTHAHYQSSLQKRDHRQKKDDLRQNISRDESQQQSMRLMTITSIAIMAFVLAINAKKKNNAVK